MIQHEQCFTTSFLYNLPTQKCSMAKKKVEEIKYTKYEKARIIGARALQISMGAPFMVKINTKKLKELKYNPIEIAKMEFENGVVPITVRR